MPSSTYQRSRSASQCSNQRSRFVRRHEELHLHLLELARAEDEVARRDLVAEGLADLRDPERRFLARELQHVLEVDEDALRRLRAQVGDRARLLHRADRRLEHQVEVARLGQIALVGFARVLGRFAPALRAPARWSARKRCPHVRQSTSGSVKPSRWPEASHTRGCCRIAESIATMSSRSRSIARHHSFLTLLLQQHAVVAEVVGRADAAVDLRGREDEAAPLAQRDDLLHRHDVVASQGYLTRPCS